MSYIKTVVLTAGTTWTVPSSWNNSDNFVLCRGAGGGGGGGSLNGIRCGSGGGGGASARISNLTLSVGQVISISIGAPGAGGPVNVNGTNGGATSFNGGQIVAAGGEGGKTPSNGTSGGLGGQASASIGTVKYSGGNGGSSSATDYYGGGGGGGAAGDTGNGSNGSDTAFGGGGAAGGNGGATGGGAGALTNLAGNGTQGDPGSNYAGGGGNGSLGDYYSSTYQGGAGGLYGAGGGGGDGAGGAGGQGVIIISWRSNDDIMPSSGEITLAQIHSVVYGSTVSAANANLNDSAIRVILNKPTTSSQISMSDAYGKTTFRRFNYTINNSGDYYSGFGSGVSTPAFSPTVVVPGIQTGDYFYIDFNCYGNWTAASYQSFRVILRYGTSIPTFLQINANPGSGKVDYYRLYYNGTNNFYIYSFYAGDSTKWPNMEQALRRFQYLGPGAYTANQLINLGMDINTYNSTIFNNQGPIRI